MRRIFFVGIHNKPGKAPLDASTTTGRIIDRICNRLGADGVSTIVYRTNLYDKDHLPTWSTQDCPDWEKRVGYDKNKDLIVMLGGEVGTRMFHYFKDVVKVQLRHPGALRWYRLSEKQFVNECAEAIKKYL